MSLFSDGSAKGLDSTEGAVNNEPVVPSPTPAASVPVSSGPRPLCESANEATSSPGFVIWASSDLTEGPEDDLSVLAVPARFELKVPGTWRIRSCVHTFVSFARGVPLSKMGYSVYFSTFFESGSMSSAPLELHTFIADVAYKATNAVKLNLSLLVQREFREERSERSDAPLVLGGLHPGVGFQSR